MSIFKSKIILLFLSIAIISGLFLSLNKATKVLPKFQIAGSIYVGWMPWFLASDKGILKQTGEKYGLDIQFVRGDYIETINQFAAGGVDAVLITNIDALALLVGSHIETDIILIGSYSNGNDAILVPSNAQNTPLAGKKLGLVEYSVSHYLLDRYLEQQQLPLDSVKKLNISDSEIAAAFATQGQLGGVVTWNPIVLQLEQHMQAHRLADSQIIPNEIADLLVVRRQTLKEHPEFAQALLATWFKMMKKMDQPENNDIFKQLGTLSGGTGKQYQAQLKTTKLLKKPQKALMALTDPKMKITMLHIKDFVKRYQLITTKVAKKWVSYGDETPRTLHFNPQPLVQFIQTQQ